MSVCECVSRLPEVGDLLLSMSIDCWLSVSSVRPAAADRKKKQHTQCVRLFEARRSCRLSRRLIGRSQPR